MIFQVADCICLFGLQQHHVVPVDTHVFQITSSVYSTFLPQLKAKKTVTNSIYGDIGKFYEDYFGSYAGWAHSVLFSAQLKHLGAETSVGKKRTKVIEETEEVISKNPRK